MAAVFQDAQKIHPRNHARSGTEMEHKFTPPEPIGLRLLHGAGSRLTVARLLLDLLLYKHT